MFVYVCTCGAAVVSAKMFVLANIWDGDKEMGVVRARNCVIGSAVSLALSRVPALPRLSTLCLYVIRLWMAAVHLAVAFAAAGILGMCMCALRISKKFRWSRAEGTPCLHWNWVDGGDGIWCWRKIQRYVIVIN